MGEMAMTKDPRTSIYYDFEGDTEDIGEYERSLRQLYPADEYPFFDDGEAVYDDDDHTVVPWIKGHYPCFFIDGNVYFPDRSRRCRGQGYYLVTYIS